MKRIFLLLLLTVAAFPAAAQYAFSPELLERLVTAYRAGDPRAVKAVERGRCGFRGTPCDGADECDGQGPTAAQQ